MQSYCTLRGPGVQYQTNLLLESHTNLRLSPGRYRAVQRDHNPSAIPSYSYLNTKAGTERMVATDMSSHVDKLLATNRRIILGSASTSRRGLMDELAQQFNFTYEVCTADIDEKAIRHEQPEQLVMLLAHAKAEAIRKKLLAAGAHAGLLITCDQVVVHEGHILEKPENAEEARMFIAGYGRSPAQTVGSVVCTDLDSGRSWQGVDIATIHFNPLPEASVEKLIDEGSVFWCAGGLMVEHELVQPHVIKMEGSLDSVMGLPKQLVLHLLNQGLSDGEVSP